MKVPGIFKACVLDQEYGGDDQFMVSVLFFSVFYQNREQEGTVVIKQTVGSDFESDALEVGPPSGQAGRIPFNHNAFRPIAEQYYRSCCGSQGRGVRIGGGAHHIRLRNCQIIQQMTFQLEIQSGGPAAW
jgi:hypothetical protein